MYFNILPSKFLIGNLELGNRLGPRATLTSAPHAWPDPPRATLGYNFWHNKTVKYNFDVENRCYDGYIYELIIFSGNIDPKSTNSPCEFKRSHWLCKRSQAHQPTSPFCISLFFIIFCILYIYWLTWPKVPSCCQPWRPSPAADPMVAGRSSSLWDPYFDTLFFV